MHAYLSLLYNLELAALRKNAKVSFGVAGYTKAAFSEIFPKCEIENGSTTFWGVEHDVGACRLATFLGHKN